MTLRDRLMVGLRTLDPDIGVQIPVPQQDWTPSDRKL